MPSRALAIGLRAWQLICAVIVVALLGNNIARATNSASAVVNYSFFTGVWWLFTLLYFLPTAFIDKFSIPIVDIVLDGLSVIFGFCAAVALAARLGAHSCSNYNYLIHNSVTNSSPGLSQNCRQAQASDAFLWFGWAAFVASFVFSLLNGRGSSVNMRGGIRRGGPAMSQV